MDNKEKILLLLDIGDRFTAALEKRIEAAKKRKAGKNALIAYTEMLEDMQEIIAPSSKKIGGK